MVFCKHPLDEKNETIEFRIITLVPINGKSNYFIGIADRSKYRKEQLISTYWKDSPSSFYWDVWNKKLVKIDENGNLSGSASNYGCECYSSTEMQIGMKYNSKKQTVSYTKNGIDQGVAFCNVPAGFFPVIDLWFESGHVEIVSNE